MILKGQPIIMWQADGAKRCMQGIRMACDVIVCEEQTAGSTCSIRADKRHPGVAVNAKFDILQRTHTAPEACLTIGAALRPGSSRTRLLITINAGRHQDNSRFCLRLVCKVR